MCSRQDLKHLLFWSAVSRRLRVQRIFRKRHYQHWRWYTLWSNYWMRPQRNRGFESLDSGWNFRTVKKYWWDLKFSTFTLWSIKRLKYPQIEVILNLSLWTRRYFQHWSNQIKKWANHWLFLNHLGRILQNAFNQCLYQW